MSTNLLPGTIIESLLFYLFASITTLGALGVILSRNSIHAVLFLILAFFNCGGVFILLQAELLAMSLIIVYVGAVAVLFLFVVMMLDVNSKELNTAQNTYWPFAIGCSILLFIEITLASYLWRPLSSRPFLAAPLENIENTRAIGYVLYTEYFLIFQLAGFVLLVAMIGAIVLTLRKRNGSRRQRKDFQLSQGPETRLTLHKVESGKGIEI